MVWNFGYNVPALMQKQLLNASVFQWKISAETIHQTALASLNRSNLLRLQPDLWPCFNAK